MGEKVLSYHRTTHEDGQKGLEQQTAMTALTAAACGGEILGSIESEIDNRNGLLKLSEAVERGKIDGIVLKDRERFRDTALFAEFEKEGGRIRESDEI